MDERLKNIVDNFENMEIGLDEPFMFHCTMCGECCINREDILLTPKDLYKIARELKSTPEQVYKKYCEGYIGGDSRMPIVRLKPIGPMKICPLLNKGKCSVHKAKPTVCAMYPIGRCMVQKKDQKPEEKDASEIKYIYVEPDCGDKAEIHTVREWLTSFGIPVEDEYFVIWQRSFLKYSEVLREVEKRFTQETMNLLWNAVFAGFYLQYDVEKEFLEQFEENVRNLTELIENIAGAMKLI